MHDSSATWITSFLFIAVVLAGYYLFSTAQTSDTVIQVPQLAPEKSGDSAAALKKKTAPAPRISWRFKKGGSHAGVRYTHVYVAVNGAERSVGEYAGECTAATVNARVSGQVAASACRYDGGGYTIGVFSERGALSIKFGTWSSSFDTDVGSQRVFKEIMKL